jgi:hypothetical protein
MKEPRAADSQPDPSKFRALHAGSGDLGGNIDE